MSLLLLLFALIIIIDCQPCVFTDTLDSSNELHLEWFIYNNVILHVKDYDQDFNYYYSPCRDDTSCGSGANQSGQIEQSWTNNICYIVSKYDDTIEPQYNTSTETWHFFYSNGWTWHCNQPRAISIYWHCNMSTNGIITLAHEIEPSCNYEMYIESKWACLGQIPTTPSNNTEFWKDPMFVIGAIICTCLIVGIIFIVSIWCLYKHCQRRKQVQDLINDILGEEDGDYGATRDINMSDNISNLSHKFKLLYPNLERKYSVTSV